MQIFKAELVCNKNTSSSDVFVYINTDICILIQIIQVLLVIEGYFTKYIFLSGRNWMLGTYSYFKPLLRIIISWFVLF